MNNTSQSDTIENREVGVKCMNCDLHFTIWTMYAGRHTPRSLHCPECGAHNAKFLTIETPLKEYIFQMCPRMKPEQEFILNGQCRGIAPSLNGCGLNDDGKASLN